MDDSSLDLVENSGTRISGLAWVFFGGYAVIFIALAISPFDRTIWFVENAPIMLLVAVVAWLHLHHHFTPISYAAMSVLVVLHTIGAHYTFANVPFGLVTEYFGFERNHFDRLAHCSVGFYAYPIGELLLKRRLVNSRLILLLFPLFAIFGTAAIYEVFEWQFALLADPQAGLAVLGSQGDVWDAQKDITADGIGALIATGLFAWVNRIEIGRIGQ
ncbi:MAG: putative membrane protein [Candidatus Pseudothioglobus sp.]|jgi:putative membrane protein